MRSIAYRFTADEPHMRTGIGIRRDKAIRVSGGEGVAHYGPYVPLPAGTYRATFRFRRDAPCRGNAVIDVCADSGSRRLAERPVDGEGIAADGMAASIEFSCPDTMANVEVRLASPGGFTAEIEALEISGELADGSAPRVQAADLPSVPIENTVSRGRNLYDGYRRGVGLQFTDLAQKIVRDPDYREARELAGTRTIVGELNLCNMFMIIKFYLPRLAPGHIVEFGSYMGGGAIFMAALARKFLPECRVFGFDTFAGMPQTDSRVDHHQAGSFSGVDLAELRHFVEESGLRNLEFVQGDFAETAAPTLRLIGAVSFCHIDCDIRSAIELAYDTTKPHMVAGGYWIFDDPMVADCLGAAEAMEDLLIRRDRLNSEQVYPHYVFRQP